MRNPRSSLTTLLIGTALLAGLASCARKSTQAPPTPAPAPSTTSETPPTPPAPPPTPPPTPPAPTPEVTFQDAFFDFDSFTLRSDAQTAMDANMRMLRDDPSLKVSIEGHCDERGTVEYNLALGEKRANAAKDYLVSAGVNTSRIETISYGKERPFDMGHDETAWAQNRRAHFVRK